MNINTENQFGFRPGEWDLRRAENETSINLLEWKVSQEGAVDQNQS
jgi:hypothetical protein